MSYLATIDLWFCREIPGNESDEDPIYLKILASFECTVRGWTGDGREEPRGFEYDLDSIKIVRTDPKDSPINHADLVGWIEDHGHEDELTEALIDNHGARDED
jgi:hypothetical protein